MRTSASLVDCSRVPNRQRYARDRSRHTPAPSAGGPISRTRAVLLALAVAALAPGCDDDHGGNGAGSATTTVGASTSTTTGGVSTTVILDTTTTSIVVDGGVCLVTWRVTNDVTLGALQFDTSYANALGEFEGSADFVDCTDLSGSLATFNDDESERRLSAGFISLAGIDAPAAVARCAFAADVQATEPPDPSDFVVTVVDAADPQLAPVAADVEPLVTCGFSPISTTTSPSTVSTSSTTVTTSTSTTFSGPLRGIGFTMLDTAARVGALQLAIDYSGAPGGFDGAGPAVDCTARTGGIVSFNDIESTSTLNAGFIVIKGMTAPRLLMDCAFTQTDRAPAPEDFVVTIVDASDTSLNPVNPLPTIAVSVPQD